MLDTLDSRKCHRVSPTLSHIIAQPLRDWCDFAGCISFPSSLFLLDISFEKGLAAQPNRHPSTNQPHAANLYPKLSTPEESPREASTKEFRTIFELWSRPLKRDGRERRSFS